LISTSLLGIFREEEIPNELCKSIITEELLRAASLAIERSKCPHGGSYFVCCDDPNRREDAQFQDVALFRSRCNGVRRYSLC
jgi:hypothetical protein